MEAEDFINLIDDCWFTKPLFKKPFSSLPNHKKLQERPSSSDRETISSDHHIIQDSEFSTKMSMHTRSKSEETLISMNSSCSFSPHSLLPEPRLDTILSGKEGVSKAKSGEKHKKKKERRVKELSKSLSELEFEELKGFMDLGFVFSEEDKKDSTLVGILPGLQRLGKRGYGGEEPSSDATATRPYLSEAWNERQPYPLIKWRVPSVSNEIGMKDSLKWWAHTVASSVR